MIIGIKEISIKNFNFRNDFLNIIILEMTFKIKLFKKKSSKIYLNIGKIKYKFKFKHFISFYISKNF